MLTAETLRNVLDYDQDTGVFRWKACPKAALNGREAGCINSDGYRVIRLFGELHYGHRLAWLHTKGEWPPFEIDHRDLDKGNNAFRNLRPATHAQNSKNGGLRANNKSGHKGVYFHEGRGKWHAQITVSGRAIHLGYFTDLDAASAAYAKASNDHHQEFGRTA